MGKLFFSFFMYVVLVLLSLQVEAVVYTYDIDNPSSIDYGTVGEITNFNTSYDNVTQQLSFSSTITEAAAANIDFQGSTGDPAVLEPTQYNGNLPDNFWLVLSDGSEPKVNYAEYAILYGDTLTGDLTAYVYDSVSANDGAASWTIDEGFIQSFDDVVNLDSSVSGQVTIDFSIDVSSINSYDPSAVPGVTESWSGVMFAEDIGIWFHPVMYEGSGVVYNPDGSILSLDVLDGTWYDADFQATIVVPVPAAAWLFGSGLLGLVGVARRKKS